MAINPKFFDTTELAKEPARGSGGSGVGATVQGLIESGAPLAGAVFGGAFGATTGLLTAGTTSIPGAVFGAALGTAGGLAIAEITRPFLTGEQTPLEEQIRREIQGGLIEGMAEGIVPGSKLLLGAARRGLKSKLVGEVLSPVATTAQNVLNKAKQFGAELSLGQITGGEGGIVDVMENVAESAFFNVKRSGRFFGRQIDALRFVQEDFLKGLGSKLTPSQAGRAVAALIDGNVTASKLVRDKLFNMVRDAAPNLEVPTGLIIDLAEREGRRGSLTAETLDRILDSGMDSLFSAGRINAVAGSGLDASTELVKRVSLDNAMTIKSQLLEFARENARSLDPIAKRASKIAGFLGNRMDSEIRSALKQVTTEAITVETSRGPRQIRVSALELYEKANRFTAITKEAFENRAIARLTQRILKDEPAQLVRAVVRPERPAALVKLERAVGTSKFNSIIRPKIFQGLIERFKDIDPTSPTAGLIDGKALLNHLRTLGDEVVEKALGPRAKDLTDLATAILVAQTRATGPGRIFTQLAQAGAGVSVVTSPFGGRIREGAIAILVGPTLLGRLFFNPKVIRGLIDGFNAGPGTTQFARAITLLSGLAVDDEINRRLDKQSSPDKLVESIGVSEAPAVPEPEGVTSSASAQ